MWPFKKIFPENISLRYSGFTNILIFLNYITAAFVQIKFYFYVIHFKFHNFLVVVCMNILRSQYIFYYIKYLIFFLCLICSVIVYDPVFHVEKTLFVDEQSALK